MHDQLTKPSNYFDALEEFQQAIKRMEYENLLFVMRVLQKHQKPPEKP